MKISAFVPSRIDTLHSAHPQRLKLVVISDLHLPERREDRYRGFDVEAHLAQVLAHIERHHPDFDALLLGGDLVQHGGAEAYRRLCGYLQDFAGLRGKPWFWIPGNHDCRTTMRQLRPDHPAQLQWGRWRLLLLDSSYRPDGRGSGELGEPQLAWLEQRLKDVVANQQLPLLLVHHHPLTVDSAWQDAIMLADAEAFWGVLQRQLPQAYPAWGLCGHIHQARRWQSGAVRWFSCPSTAVQFVAGTAEMALATPERDGNEALPGYRWLELAAQNIASDVVSPDESGMSATELRTGVEWVDLA